MNILRAIGRRLGSYTCMKQVFHAIQLDKDHWVGVAGDGDNGSYEYFVMLHGGILLTSDCGYGDPSVALRDVLVKEVL